MFAVDVGNLFSLTHQPLRSHYQHGGSICNDFRSQGFGSRRCCGRINTGSGEIRCLVEEGHDRCSRGGAERDHVSISTGYTGTVRFGDDKKRHILTGGIDSYRLSGLDVMQGRYSRYVVAVN